MIVIIFFDCNYKRSFIFRIHGVGSRTRPTQINPFIITNKNKTLDPLRANKTFIE